MDEISVHAILLKYGTWIESSQFVNLVAKEREVGERQAYNFVKEAYESKNEKERIFKHVFSDRTVIYGLAEFGPPIRQETIIKHSGVHPLSFLTERERELYRLDVEYLASIKQIAEGYSNDPEWVEWIRREEEEFKQKWGIV